jgi:hypothetical protein
LSEWKKKYVLAVNIPNKATAIAIARSMMPPEPIRPGVELTGR